MGNGFGSFSLFTEDILDEYNSLTYLSRKEILNLFKLFNLGKIHDFDHRFRLQDVEKVFPKLKVNPLKDRIVRVFSTKKDDLFSFEDILDLCSIMSDQCPIKVKALWVFKILDFDEDNEIGENDINTLVTRLKQYNSETECTVEIYNSLIKEITTLGSITLIGENEFQIVMEKVPDFCKSLSLYN